MIAASMQVAKTLATRSAKVAVASFNMTAALVVLTVALVPWFVFVSAFSRKDENPYDDAAFVRAQWLAHPHDRGSMAEDLRRTLLERRPTREEVRILLGPDDTRTFYADRMPPGSLLSYDLGVWSGILDLDSFDIYFDQADRVSRIEFIQH
jgi:hypothetical protein